MKKLIWLCTCVLALSQIKPFQSEIVLVNEEILYIDLYEYFYGDCLVFNINSTDIALMNSYVDQSRYNIKQDIPTTLPFKISELLYLYPKYFPNQFLVYAGDSDVTVLFLNLESFYSEQRDLIKTDPIFQIRVKESRFNITVLILSRNNELFYSTADFLGISPGKFSNATLIEVSLPDTPCMAKGFITDQLLITGYNEGDAYAYFFDVLFEDDVYLKQKILLSTNNSEPHQQILSLTFSRVHFIVSQATSQLIRFSTNDFDLLFVDNVLYLPVFAENVTSINLNVNKDMLFIGIKGGFMMISFDFQQIYTKVGPAFSENVFVTSGPFQDIILTGQDHIWNLFELGEYHDIIAKTNFEIEETTFMWNVFCFEYPNYKFVYGINENLSIFNISFFGPRLEVKSFEDPMDLLLTAVQNSPYRETSVVFTVRRPENNTAGSVELLSCPEVLLEFQGLKSTQVIQLPDYVIGANLTVSDYSFKIDMDYEGYFNTSIDIIKNFEKESDIALKETDYTKVLHSGHYLILYNSFRFSVLNKFREKQWQIENSEIEEIIGCEEGFMIYYRSNNDSSYYLVYVFNAHYIDFNYSTEINEECEMISCSKNHAICLTSENIILYQILFNVITNPIMINRSFFNSNITTLSIVYSDYLLVICDYYNFVVLDIDYFFLTKKTVVLVNSTLSYNIISVISGLYVYLIDDSKNAYVYDSSMNYLKKYSFPLSAKLTVTKQYLISEHNGAVQVIDTNQFVTNSTIADVSIPLPVNYAANFKTINKTLKLYFLYSDKVSIYTVPPDYNSLKLLTNIINKDDLYHIEYPAYISINISNSFSSQSFNINLTLFVNGATIYKNTTSIELVQKQFMNYQCGDSRTISIDKIFLGQGLNGELVNKKYIQLNQRFKVTENIFEANYSLYLFSSNFQMYLAVYGCSVFLLSFDLQSISSLDFADDDKICKCFSQSLIIDADFIGFVFGCNIIHEVLGGFTYIDYYKNILLFGTASSTEIISLNIKSINYTAGKVSVSSKMSGDFLLLTSENFEINKTDSFYSAHLSIFTGNIQLDSFSIDELSCDYSVLFSLHYYYLTDYVIYYDPLFDFYYVYSLDIYFGLRIFSISKSLCSQEFTLEMAEAEAGYSLEICGQMMYIVNKNTCIDLYKMNNWTYPSYRDSIIINSGVYETIQASLICSSSINPEYLLFQMKNFKEIYLHIVDIQASKTANTVINYPITTISNNYSVFPYVAFLNTSGYLIVIDESYAQICIINPFILVIDTGDECANYKNNFTIKVTNTNGDQNSAVFTLTVRDYNQGSVKSTKLNILELALIGISLFFLLVLVFICFKKIWLKFRSKRTRAKVLFEYEKDLVLTEEQFIIRINKSFD